MSVLTKDVLERIRTGVKGGELKVGVGSRVDSAEAPVSPRGSAPKLLGIRRGRGMFVWGIPCIKAYCPGPLQTVEASRSCLWLSRAMISRMEDFPMGDEPILSPKPIMGLR